MQNKHFHRPELGRNPKWTGARLAGLLRLKAESGGGGAALASAEKGIQSGWSKGEPMAAMPWGTCALILLRKGSLPFSGIGSC
jgi:hypothetical protein